MSAPTAYPLTWPPQFPRCTRRESGAFKTTLAGALKNVQDSLRKFADDSGKKLDGLVISSNVTLGAHNPADPGVAIWFVWDGLQVCIPVDRYAKVESNLQAIHHIIEARRTELRHGTLALVRATFTGFKALPAAKGSDWWDVLETSRDCTLHTAELQYKRLRSNHHPDKGGDPAKFDVVQRAWEQAQQEIGR